MDILRIYVFIRLLPFILGLALTLPLMGMMAVYVVLQGVENVAHGKTFFPPEPPRRKVKPTGLSIWMQHALTSPAGRNAARKHLLIPDHPSTRKGAQHGQ